MNRQHLNRLYARVAAIAPNLVGGTRTVTDERTALLLDALGPATIDDALHALTRLTRQGLGSDELNWSRIVAETLTVMRARTDTQTPLPITDDRELIPMPADFWQQVERHRDRARAQRQAQ